MSPSGGIMRRQFNPDLLPTAPPAKVDPKNRKVKTRRFPEIKNFFDLYISLSRGKWKRKEMAKAIGYSLQSISHWRYGTPPGKQSHRPIAKYFSSITRISAPLILTDLEHAYFSGFERWYAEEKQKQKKETE